MTELQDNLNQSILKRIIQKSDNIQYQFTGNPNFPIKLQKLITYDKAATKKKMFMEQVAPLIASLYVRNVLDLSNVMNNTNNKLRNCKILNQFKGLKRRLSRINSMEVPDRKKLFMSNIAPTLAMLFLMEGLNFKKMI